MIESGILRSPFLGCDDRNRAAAVCWNRSKIAGRDESSLIRSNISRGVELSIIASPGIGEIRQRIVGMRLVLD